MNLISGSGGSISSEDVVSSVDAVKFKLIVFVCFLLLDASLDASSVLVSVGVDVFSFVLG